MGKSGFPGALASVLSFSMLATSYSFAGGPASNPFNSCGMGPDYSTLAEALIEREVALVQLMGIEAQRLEPLESTKSKYMRDSAIWTAAEFSAFSLGVNAILFSSSVPAVAAALEQAGVGVSTNKGLLLRQLINGSIGTVSTAWAATYHDAFGPINSGLPSEAQEIQGEIDTDNIDGGIDAEKRNALKRDKDYGYALNHLHEMTRLYSEADNSITQQELAQHDQNVETYGVTSFLEKHPGALIACQQPTGAMDADVCGMPANKDGWRVYWHILKQAPDPWKGKKETINIQETAIQAHITLYQDELKFLQGEVGRLLARCEERLATLDSQNPRVSPEAISDIAEKIGETLRTGSGNSGSRAPASAGTLK